MTNARPRDIPLPRVSAVVLAWRAEPWLRRCVTSLLGSEKVDIDVVLVDNGCTTDDVEVLGELDRVQIVRPGRNLGYAEGNNVGVAASAGDYVALVNQDAIVEPGTLSRLVEELAISDVAVVAASARLAEDPRLLNSSGTVVHVLGLSWVGDLGEPETRSAPTDTAGATGAGLVTTRTHWDRLGGFFEHYFAYYEDADLSLRTWRLGLRVVSVPDAVLVHRYEFSRNSNKFYLLERNRLMFVLTMWSGRALLLLGPALIALELAMLVLAIRQGWLRDKVRGWVWLWNKRGKWLARRRVLQAERVRPESEWMRLLTARVDTPLIDVPPAVLTPLNTVVSMYWRLVRRLV